MIGYYPFVDIVISVTPVAWDALLRAGVTGAVFFAAMTNNRPDLEDAIKPTGGKSSMKRREKIIFWGGVTFLAFLFSIAGWFVLGFLAWYVKRVPEKRLPMTDMLTGNQKQFYDWLSEFLWDWLKSSILWTVGLWIAEVFIGRGLLFIADLVAFPLANLLLNPVFIFMVAYLTTVIAILYSLSATIFMHWTVLFWQAEPAARLLVGNENYDLMTDDEKELIKRNVVDSQVGINKATIVVAGGKIQTQNPPAGNLAKFGGPGVLIVQEGHAVVLERGGRRSRIVGTGVHHLGMFERINTMIFLDQRTVHIEIGNVVTRDHVVISKIKLMAFTRLDAGDKSHENGDYPFDEKVISNLVWSPKMGQEAYDWSGAVKSVADTAVRDLVARQMLDDVVLASGQARDTMRSNLKDAINRITKDKLGVTVSSIVIGEIVIPETAQQKLLERWLIDWEAEIRRVNADTEKITSVTKAEGERDASIAKAEAEYRSIVTKAEAERDARIAKGEGERNFLIKQGEGKAFATRAEEFAKAEGEAEKYRQFLLALAQLPISDAEKSKLVQSLLQGDQYRDMMRMTIGTSRRMGIAPPSEEGTSGSTGSVESTGKTE